MNQKRIIIVDDDDSVLVTIARILELEATQSRPPRPDRKRSRNPT